MHDTFSLPFAYTRWSPTPGEPFTEMSFSRRTIAKTFSRSQVALVLVDLWNVGWGPDPLVPELGWEAEWERGQSNVERMQRITLDQIVPAMHAARAAGLTIVHLNLPEIAARYPAHWHQLDPPLRTVAQPPPATLPSAPPPIWPPQEFTTAWRMEHETLVFDSVWMHEHSARAAQRMDIPAPARPQNGDVVVTNGAELHAVATERQLCVLFYAGFDTNQCVLYKPGGVCEMVARGYLCPILRDATTSKEVAETVHGEWITRVTITEIERDANRGGFTVLTADFIRACQMSSGKSARSQVRS